MAHQMQLDLPDQQYLLLASLAADQGKTPEELVLLWLAERQEIEEEREFWGDEVIASLNPSGGTVCPDSATDLSDDEFLHAIHYEVPNKD